MWSTYIHIQAANLRGFRASVNPRFEAGIPDFMNGILNFPIHFNVVHRKVDWRNPKMKSLNSMPDIFIYWYTDTWVECIYIYRLHIIDINHIYLIYLIRLLS